MEERRLPNGQKVKVNKKRKLPLKYKLKRTIAIILLVTTLATGTFAIGKKHYDAKIDKQNQYIVSMYGEDSEEKKVLDYIDLSNELEDFNKLNMSGEELASYISNGCVFSDKLDSLNVIREKLNEAKETRVKDNPQLFVYLISQENLVNLYLYKDGYNIAHSRITRSVKAYARQILGIPDSYHIELYDAREENSYEIRVVIDNESHYVPITGNEMKKILDGILLMAYTDKNRDKNKYDNNIHNKDRNERIRDALALSAYFYEQTNLKDFYYKELPEIPQLPEVPNKVR